FELNFEKNYINGVKQDVSLRDEKKNKEYIIQEGKALSLTDYLELSKKYLDETWIKANQNEDISFIKDKVNQTESTVKNNYQEKGFIGSIKQSINKDAIVEEANNIDELFYEILVKKNISKLESLKKIIRDSKNKELVNTKLLDFYQMINYYPNTEDNIKLKEEVTKLIEETALTEEQKNNFKEDFSKINTYNYLDSVKDGYKKVSDATKKKFEELKGSMNLDGIKNLFNQGNQ
ncbi:MAG: hypothetical protein PHO80_04470, partial [Candidatus Gracilibacteria bacterium]|nr:hypothetical protein [Candidatus Gracilibacteria bacterium]